MNATNLVSTARTEGVMLRLGRAVGDLLGVAPDAATGALLRARYGLLGALAAVDHIVTSHEVELVSQLMDRDRLSLAARAIAVTAFDDGRRRRLDTLHAIAQVIERARDGRAEAACLLDDLIALAASDGRIRRSEHDWLGAVCACMNMDREGLLQRIRERHPEASVA